MDEIFDFASVGSNQGLKTNFLLLMWTCFDTPNFKQPMNCFSFGIVTAFCKFVSKTNRQVRNNVQVPAELFL